MNGANVQPWPDAADFDMDAATDQDFGNLIDFDSLDLDFAVTGYGHDAQDSQQMAHLVGSLDVHHLQSHFSPQMPQDHGAPPSSNGLFNYGMAQYSQAGAPPFTQPEEHVYRPHQHIPPTPSSIELHSEPHRYMPHRDAQQAVFDQRYHVRKNDAAFTPLVSPAVTPHDGRFQIPDFTTPGAYFSPLTSPALTAQSQQHAPHHSQTATSESSMGQSPDVDIDLLGEPEIAPQEQGRRLRSTNRRTAPRTGTASNRPRQSPVVRATRRKATVSSLIPPKEISELVHDARPTRPSSSGLEVPRSRTSSETDSISPEPLLSDMPPPPLPGSLTASPAIKAHRDGQSAAPATPASLMRMHPSPNFHGDHVGLPQLDDLTLPEASLPSPITVMDMNTPRISARKTPKLSALSTPGATMSSKPSPMLDSVSTPTSPAFSMVNGKKDAKLARNPKKRNSISSNLVSPALMPRISPVIKPLLPDAGQGMTDNTHALLLASKSNYQNILDGTTVPGVVYPTSLSTNLTSKRTSHKIAEQGRRNRINMALQEMQALLPSPIIAAADAKSPESSAQQSNNSKAAKVESAIDYIRQLKQQVSEKDQLLDKKDQEMEELRKELAALRRGSKGVVDVDAVKAEPATSPVEVNGT